MSNMIFLTFIFSIILAVMIFSGLIKTVKFTFGKPPAESTSQSEDIQRTQSEKTADLAEKNRQLMDRVRAQMERNKH